jgi:hypothetical protein
MIETLLRVVRILLWQIPFLLLALLNAKANLKRQYRDRQFLMPPLALLCCVLLAVFQTKLSDLLLALVNLLPDKLTALGSQVANTFSGLGNGITAVGTALGNLLQSVDPAYLLLFLFNTVFILLYIILKRILITILDRVFQSDNAFHRFFAGIAYEKDRESGLWHLRSQMGQARTFARTMYIAALVISEAAVLLSCELYRGQRLASLFYPVFGIIVIGEIYFFLDGLNRQEAKSRLTGEKDQAASVSNYALLRQVLAKLFGDKLGADDTTVDSGFAHLSTSDELLHKLESGGDPKLEAYGRFMRLKSQGGLELDHNYLTSGVDLLQGKSVLFNNPFYYDLIPYIFYPMNRTMLRRKKVLLVLGRHNVEQDITRWCEDGLRAVTNVPGMWNLGVLTGEPQDLDVGIVSRSSVHDLALHEANSDFFREVEFVVILEPSKLVSTAQIGLSSLVRSCRKGGNPITFCSVDKNCDGLVDSLSHILQTSLTEVSATGHHRGICSYMCWETGGEHLQHRMLPNLSRYLGMGTELSFAALKNQVSETFWYGGEAFPVLDIHWIAKQYYYDLLHYADLPTSQEAMDVCFRVSPNLWDARVKENQYLTVEDEGCNMFEIKRDFASRAKNQGFLNIISPEYLLKDYMLDNDGIFNADPKAIPYIVADYAPTPRNIILRLCLRMSAEPVGEEEIRRELMLLDADEEDLSVSLWHEICLCCKAVGDCITDKEGSEFLSVAWGGEPMRFGRDTLRTKRRFSLESGQMETLYFITDRRFIALFLGDLQNAGYLAEDEKGDRHYLGSELRGHVFQKYLPGQFFTFGGKYYEMLRVNKAGQVLVRRAADHITGRPAYRQVRHYYLASAEDARGMGDRMDVSGLCITKQYADIRVETPAYWKLDKYNDFESGRKIALNGVPTRFYRSKQVLRIDLPKEQGEVSQAVLQTIALLFNESFRTLFGENSAYLAVVTCGPVQAPMTYQLMGEGGFDPGQGCLYIIEDSHLDLGLLVSVQRNLGRIFSILTDYLSWHTEAVYKSLGLSPSEGEPQEATAEENKESFASRTLASTGTVTPTEGETPAAEAGAPPAEGETPPTEGETAPEPTEEEPPESHGEPEGDTLEPPTEDELTFEPDGARAGTGSLIVRTPYHLRHYLLYGGVSVPGQLDLSGTLRFLEGLGFDQNELRQAREGKHLSSQIQGDEPTIGRYCDFCGAELVGTEYEILADGRERCMVCSRSAVRTEAEFREIYRSVARNLESFFGARITAPIRVEMVNAKKLHKKLGRRFVPTGNYDGRVLGVAIRNKEGYSILLENGAPRMQSIMTMAHELTHIWQYLNWNQKTIRATYGKDQELEIYEGMAKWVEIQYAYLIGEPGAANRELAATLLRQDEYGQGLKKYLARYPLSTELRLYPETPFVDKDHPL